MGRGARQPSTGTRAGLALALDALLDESTPPGQPPAWLQTEVLDALPAISASARAKNKRARAKISEQYNAVIDAAVESWHELIADSDSVSHLRRCKERVHAMAMMEARMMVERYAHRLWLPMSEARRLLGYDEETIRRVADQTVGSLLACFEDGNREPSLIYQLAHAELREACRQHVGAEMAQRSEAWLRHLSGRRTVSDWLESPLAQTKSFWADACVDMSSNGVERSVSQEENTRYFEALLGAQGPGR